MQRLSLTAETFTPPPLGSDERIAVVQGVLAARGIMARRMSHATTVGLTITYAHMSEAADAPAAAQVLADALDWEDTEVSTIPGGVAIATRRG